MRTRTTFLALAALLATACGESAFTDAASVQRSVTVDAAGAADGGTAGTTSSSPDSTGTPGNAAGGAVDDDQTAMTGTSGTTGTTGGARATSGGDSSGGSDPSSGPSTPSGSGGAGSGRAGTTDDQGGPGSPAGDVRGVTADTVTIGVVRLTSFQEIGAAFGAGFEATGDTEGQLRAMVEWVNANGGVAGREVDLRIREYDPMQASPNVEAQMCAAFADDDEVFAVVLQGQVYASTRACYAGKGVLMVDPSPFSFDDDHHAELSPWLWSPSFPNYSRVVRTLATELGRVDFMAPMTARAETSTLLGVVHWDEPTARRTVETDLAPALAAQGIEIALTHGVDSTDAGTIQQGLLNGITRFRNVGINRVVFVGGNPLAPLWYINAESAGYRPRYGVTSLDSPRDTTHQDSSSRQMADAIGIGFNLVYDVDDAQAPVPANATEARCLDIMAKAGHTFSTRPQAQYALAYCEAFLLLQAGAKNTVAALDPASWVTGAEALGSSFHPATTLGAASFGSRKHDGPDLWRPLAWDAACTCMGYTGPASRLR